MKFLNITKNWEKYIINTWKDLINSLFVKFYSCIFTTNRWLSGQNRHSTDTDVLFQTFFDVTV